MAQATYFGSLWERRFAEAGSENKEPARQSRDVYMYFKNDPEAHAVKNAKRFGKSPTNSFTPDRVPEMRACSITCLAT